MFSPLKILCMFGNLWSSAAFFEINFFEKFFYEHNQNVGPDLGPNI